MAYHACPTLFIIVTHVEMVRFVKRGKLWKIRAMISNLWPIYGQRLVKTWQISFLHNVRLTSTLHVIMEILFFAGFLFSYILYKKQTCHHVWKIWAGKIIQRTGQRTIYANTITVQKYRMTLLNYKMKIKHILLTAHRYRGLGSSSSWGSWVSSKLI